MAPLFLMLLRGGETMFKRTHLPVTLKLGLGGLVVGVISIWQPEVWGNGYGVVESILNNPWTWQALLTILFLKVLATVATTGSGAVGGVFTPTLFCGAALGAIYGEAVHALFPHTPTAVSSFAVVGMGCFPRRDDARADHVDPDHVRDDARRRDDHAADAGLRLRPSTSRAA